MSAWGATVYNVSIQNIVHTNIPSTKLLWDDPSSRLSAAICLITIDFGRLVVGIPKESQISL